MLKKEEFFPTPKNVIRTMLKPYNSERLSEMTILEPSAGRGDILDHINETVKNFRGHKSSLYCCEIDSDLKYQLGEKGYRIIADDFLQYSGDYFFDLIVMNPPFSNGDEHLLKAWDILEEGDIVCLLNAETIDNPYTERRKHLAKIIKDNKGKIERLGDCFKQSERKTEVNVVLIRLTKVSKRKRLDFDFENIKKEDRPELSDNLLKDTVATRDVIGNMILQYEQLKKIFIRYMEAEEELRFYAEGMMTSQGNIIKMAQSESKHFGNRRQRYNNFTDDVKSEIWKVIFAKTGMERYMTDSVRKNFSKFVEVQGAMDFTRENFFNIIKTLIVNKDSILEQAVIDVFNMFTSHHEENRYLVTGWKTNDKWKVNRKVILPYWLTYGAYMSGANLKKYGDHLHISTHRWSEYGDIDKVMCYLTGKTYEEIVTLESALKDCFHRIGKVYTGTKFDNTGQSEFFTFKFWRKGTLHIEFKDKFLWQEFNMRACAGKNWLPEAEKKAWESERKDIKRL